jgi:GTP-binding protein
MFDDLPTDAAKIFEAPFPTDLGRGLGHDFLRHIVRTKILIHLIDGTSVSPLEDMGRVNTELTLYDAALAQKPQMVVVNKIDLPGVQARLPDINDAFKAAGIPALFISAARGDGIGELIAEAVKMLGRLGGETEEGKKIHKTIFRPQPKGDGISVRKEGDVFIVASPELERLVDRVDTADPEVRRQLQRQLGRLKINRALEVAGVKPGDKVRCGNYEWEW